ncbi:Ubiquitin_carboxyl-terminal hydrolase family protein [Hexamita inflata]|uniref:Ubiquitin_carboxyl-terminal hydrolase family protein n=1 Tax=Hexamita inflata TaxID=28002 RepID=A0ABP1GE69_9EUKA
MITSHSKVQIDNKRIFEELEKDFNDMNTFLVENDKFKKAQTKSKAFLISQYFNTDNAESNLKSKYILFKNPTLNNFPQFQVNLDFNYNKQSIALEYKRNYKICEDNIKSKGLTKNGATCYLNALLQAIYNTDAGYNAILRGPNDKEVIERIEKAGEFDSITQDDQSVVSALQLIFLRLIYSKKQSLSTVKFCKALGIDTSKQEDANELMKNVLDKLERASKAHDAKDKFEHTLQVYKETFEGQNGSTVKCQYCQHESLTQTPFTDMMLPVEDDFFKCFAAMVKKQEIDGYQCASCNNKTKSLQYSSVQKVPDLLCMTLQRFKQNEYGEASKDNKQVRMPIILDLEFIKNCNLGEIGSEATVAEMAELFRIVMMPWLYFKVEPRQILANSEAAQQFASISPQFTQHLRAHYDNFRVENIFSSNNDHLLQIPIFKINPPNIFVLKTIVRHSGSLTGGHYKTLVLSRPNIIERFQMVECNDSSVSQVQGFDGNNIQSEDNYMYFYERAKIYENGQSFNLSQYVQNNIQSERK